MKSRIPSFLVVAAALAFTPAITPAQTITDNFSDLNDTANPAWTHLSGLVSSTGQSWDASGGNYRLQALNNGFTGYGFVGSYVPTSYTDSITRADFVNFAGPGANPVFAVAARLNGNNAFNQLGGYGLAYEPFAASLAGEMVLYEITGASLGDLGSIQLTLDPAKDYTFELIIQGSQLTGNIYEIGGGLVGTKTATDSTYASGFSGVLGYGQNGVTPPTDFTVDNFSVSLVPEPTAGCLLGAGFLALLAQRRARGHRV
jgi:hypothetical protein